MVNLMGQTYESVGCQLSLCAHLTTLLGKEIGESSNSMITHLLSRLSEIDRNTFAGKLEEYVSWNPTI
jgi:hypothetical protein